MKRYLCLVLTLGLTLPLWAEDPDPMNEMVKLLSQYFDTKTYFADKRILVEADLAVPGEVLLPLQTTELSYLRLLRHEIAARHGYIFEDQTLNLIFKGTKWYRPLSRTNPQNFNDFERNNLLFIERRENAILLKGEREIKGWASLSPSTERRDEIGSPASDKNAAIKLLTPSPARVKRSEVLTVKLKVTNRGNTPWSPIGKTTTQEGGKYYISSCWIDPNQSSRYALADQFPFPREVRPGETVEATGTLTAPEKTGTYYITFCILKGMAGRFLDGDLPSPQSELANCPKLLVTVTK